MMTGIDESKILFKHPSFQKSMQVNVTRIKSGITITICVSEKILKNTIHVKKIILGILIQTVAKIVII